MEKTDEENELEPTGESDNSQETDESGDTNNNSDSSSDSSEQGNESLSFDSSGAVLVSEIGKVEGENIETGDQDREGNDQDGLERAIEKELDKYFEQEAEFIKAYQEMVGKERALDQVRERESEDRQMTDEEWEKEVEIAAYNAKLIYESMEETGIKIPENKEDLEIEKEVEQSEEISEPRLSDLKEEVIEELVEKQYEETELLKEQEEKEVLEAQASKLKEDVGEQKQELEPICEGKEPLEQHQVEPYIKETLETEQENIIKEKELEQYQELELEEQFKTINFNEFIEELVEKQYEEAEQLKEQEEKEALEAQASKIKEANSELYEVVEVERDALDQHEVEATIEEELETIPEHIINEKEVEKLQELDIEEQFQMIHLNEYVDELVERQDEDKNIENDKIKQEKENIEQTQEVIHQSTYLQEKLEEQEQELKWEYEEKDIVEQHQVEAAIEEELKTEPKPIVNEEELEYIKNLEPEKQLEAELFYEFIEELANKQNEEKEEHEVPQEIKFGESEVESISQEGELEQETTSPDEEVVEQREIEECKDHQQELEEILDQIRKIEQEALIEIEVEEEESDKTIEKNYERVKKLYKQQTGKRPIYANKETKGFKQWLEQKKKSEEKGKTKQKKELKEEQKKEEDWKTTFKEWIEEVSEEKCNVELKSELKKALESYNEFEGLTRKFMELYEKSQNEKLSEKEKNILKSLTKRLQELDPIQLELLTSVFFIKNYITEQYGDDFWNTPLVNLELSKFYKHISQKYKELRKVQENKENSELIIKNWIEQVSEGEIRPELKVKLKEIVENYGELEELATMFMKLYTKEQREKLSKHEEQELKVLTKTLQELESGKIELFANIRAIKHFLNDQNFDEFSDKARVNRILSHFFKHIPQKIIKLKKAQENKENLEVLNLELDAIEIESKDKKDFLEEITKLGSEESDEEDWKTTLKQWIKEASEEECNAELKSELKKALESYNEFEDLTRKFLELFKKSQYENLAKIEKNMLKILTERLQGLGPIQLELLANIRAFKDYYYNHLWELMNRFFVNRVRSKIFKHISQEYNRVILEYEDFKYTKQEINLRENNNTFEEKLQFNKSEIKVTNQEKALIREEDSAGIPIQRILEKINNHKENIENDFYFKKSFPLLPTSKVTLTPHKQSSVGRKKNISIDNNNLNFHNLLDELLLKSYEEFYIEHFALKVKNPYANTGRTLRAVFINWIKERYSNDNPKKDILLRKINIINENEEIAHYILYLLINSNVTQIGLNSILLKFHLNVSRETVRTIAKKNFTNEDYKKKFSKGDGWNKFNLQNSENYKKLIFSSLLNKELHKFFEQYYMNTGNYANFGKKITKNFIDWIKQRNIDASKKKDIFELIENINENKEILNYIIYHGKNYINSNSLNKLPLKVFSNKFTPLFLTVSDLTIQRIITKHIFQGNINEFRKLFPVGGRKKKRIVDFVNLSFDSLLNSSLIDRFRVYKEVFYTSTNHIYANHGMEITEDFIKWININECDITEKENLINLCKKINENEEILSFIIHLTLNTNYNLSEIARELNLINLNGQRNTITRIVKEYIFNFDKEEFDNRFHTSDIVSQTGLSTHLCLNSLISLFFNKNGIYRYYSEIRIFPPSNKQADGFFLNFKFSRFFYDRLTKFEDSERLIKALNIKKDLLNKVVGVQIEFTSDLSNENILSKCTKYQNNSILLIIVGTNWKDKNNNRQIVPNISEILYPDKVLIINPKLFTKLLNFDSSFIQEFNKILEYSKNSDIESLERYNDNIYHRITFYDTNDLIKDIELQFFEKYFYDPEIELNEMEIPQLFSKFITYCKDNSLSLEIKTITRGSFIGKYYIFNTIHLRQFIYQINKSYNLVNLAEVLGNYIGQDNIFFKKITYLNSAGKLKDSRRGILIKYSFLNNYQEEF